MLTFAFAVILELSVSVGAVQSTPLADPLPPGALVRIGATRFAHRDPISWVGFANDKTLLTAANDDGLRFWDIASGKESASYYSWSPRSTFVLSADGKKLAVNDYRASVMRIIDASSRKEIRRLSSDVLFGPENERYPIHRFLLSPDGRFLAIWDELPPNFGVPFERQKLRRFSIDVWDLNTGVRIREFKAGDLREVEFTPDGKSLVSQERGKENRLRSWDIGSGKELRRLELPRAVHRFVFLPDGKTLLGLSEKRESLHLFETEPGKELRVIADKGEPIATFAISPDGTSLALIRGGRLIVRRLDNGKVALDVPYSPNLSVERLLFDPVVELVAFSPNGKTLAVAKGRRLELWDLATGTRLHPDDSMGGPVLAVHTHGPHLLTRDMDLGLTLWDMPTGKLQRRFLPGTTQGAEEGIQYSRAISFFDWAGGCQAISPDGQKVASLWFDGPIQLFELTSGDRLRSFKGSEKATCLALSPNGKLLAGPALDGRICLWSVTSGKVVQRLALVLRPDTRDGPLAIQALHFSPDGRTLTASAFREGDTCDILSWELATGALRLSQSSKTKCAKRQLSERPRAHRPA